MRFLSFLTCVFSLSLVQANETSYYSEGSDTSNKRIEENSVKNLAVVGKRYIDLLNRIGAAQNFSHEEEVENLCAPKCKKIVNGSIWFEDVEGFLPQLLATAEKVGFWSIESLDIIPGNDERTVVVRFLVHTENAGIWNTIVILRCNDQLLISEINEIFNSYEGIN